MGLLRKTPRRAVPLALLLLAVSRVHLLEIQTAAKVHAFVGEPVTLSCWFKTSLPVTEKFTIDWTYQPLAGGDLESVFHYQSNAYPAEGGNFHDRISWAGDVAKNDASITISKPTLEDNGTFTCAVKNPPDVHHNIPQTLLMVTQRGASFRLTSSGLLSILVFLPSAVVMVLLLVRMSKKSGLVKAKRKLGYQKSSIEVSDELPERVGCKERMADCCLQCVVHETPPQTPASHLASGGVLHTDGNAPLLVQGILMTKSPTERWTRILLRKATRICLRKPPVKGTLPAYGKVTKGT